MFLIEFKVLFLNLRGFSYHSVQDLQHLFEDIVVGAFGLLSCDFLHTFELFKLYLLVLPVAEADHLVHVYLREVSLHL